METHTHTHTRRNKINTNSIWNVELIQLVWLLHWMTVSRSFTHLICTTILIHIEIMTITLSIRITWKQIKYSRDVETLEIRIKRSRISFCFFFLFFFLVENPIGPPFVKFMASFRCASLFYTIHILISSSMSFGLNRSHFKCHLDVRICSFIWNWMKNGHDNCILGTIHSKIYHWMFRHFTHSIDAFFGNRWWSLKKSLTKIAIILPEAKNRYMKYFILLWPCFGKHL